MTKIIFIEEILADIDWRTAELAMIKIMPKKYSLDLEHTKIQLKYSVPAIYAIWEGFVKSCFSTYAKHLNELVLSRQEVSMSLLTYCLDSVCHLSNPRNNFESKHKFVEAVDKIFDEQIVVPQAIPTESNVGYKAANKILKFFCIPLLEEKPFKQELDKLLLFRNKIAHGENSIQVGSENIVEFVATVEKLMHVILLRLESSNKLKSYARNCIYNN